MGVAMKAVLFAQTLPFGYVGGVESYSISCEILQKKQNLSVGKLISTLLNF
jgi:hypothetical protein